MSNLELAWRRITTGRNLQYKKYFRPLYLSYELSYRDNLRYLHKRLKGGWTPTTPTRIYIPKASGLQRPITLLDLEDQIVLQAVANAFASKLDLRRKGVEYKVVFSNVLNRRGPEFFFQDWRRTYSQYTNKRFGYLFAGNRWIAHFDLASYYDTISHEILIRRVASRGGSRGAWATVRDWLRCWSTIEKQFPYDHGIPQGPIASDFLAEAFLLTLDEELLSSRTKYARYVDDITLFGKTRREVQDAALHLERLCRSLGLIPQGGKYAIREISVLDDVEELPSLAPPDRDEWDHSDKLDAREAERMFANALDGRPYQIKNRTQARYVLYRAPRSKKLLGYVLRLLERHPEHVDAFTAYLENYTASKPLEREVVRILQLPSPYEYVRGELWHILSRIASDETLQQLRDLAKAELTRTASIAVRWGALRFLFECERRGHGLWGRRIKSQPPLLQSLLVRDLPQREFRRVGAVSHLLASKHFEPGITLAPLLSNQDLSHRTYDLRIDALRVQVQNVLRTLGVIRRRRVPAVDQVFVILKSRYGLPDVRKWKDLLGAEYGHALQMLIQADAYYTVSPSDWLVTQNAFNDAVLKALIGFVNAHGLRGSPLNVRNVNYQLIDMGVLLQPNGPLDRAYPSIAIGLREGNARRNRLPPAHPYDKKTGERNKFLRRAEQRTLARGFEQSYRDIMQMVDATV